VTKFDPSTPSIARVYDYILGGKDNFQADRELADRLLTLVPLIAELVPENRQFLSRAATWVANQGIGQFIDLGCGMPTAPNTHESVQAIDRDARVAYVDNDPVVVNLASWSCCRQGWWTYGCGSRAGSSLSCRPETTTRSSVSPGSS